MVFGLKTTELILPPYILRVLASLGILIYIGTGVVTMLRGGNFLDYDLLSLNPVEGQHLGILLIEHDMSVVMGISDRIVVLDYGRCIANDAPDAVRNDPAVIRAYLGEEEDEALPEDVARDLGMDRDGDD